MIKKFSNATPIERSEYLLSRYKDLKAIRDPFMQKWREISEYIYPFMYKDSIHDKMDNKSFDKILNAEPIRCVNILTSGLASSATSPVRQWFKIALQQNSNNYNLENASWCADVERLMLKVYQESNTYNSLFNVYKELVTAGTAVDLIYDDYNNIIRHHVLTAGEYCIAQNSTGIVDTLYREFQLTVAQAVQFFGYDKLSLESKKLYDTGKLDEDIYFIHAIEPREDRNYNSKSNLDFPYASYYLEINRSDKGTIVYESGFKYFPAVCPRWDTLGNNAYGISPSMVALPDVKQLALQTECKTTILEKLANPPIQAPTSARQQPISLTPGAVNFTSNTSNEQQLKPIMAQVGDYNAITQDNLMLEKKINSAYYVDLFLLIQNAQTDRKTATEIYALKEEKMLVLSAVMERLQHELLSPLVLMTYEKLKDGNLIPPAPLELQGDRLDIEFSSMLAQSQRAVDINNVDRFISSMQAVGATSPDILDRLNPDGLVDTYADRLAVDPRVLRSREEAQEIRVQRQQQMQQQLEAEQAQAMGNTASSLAQAQKLSTDASLATQQLDAIGTM